MGVVTQTLQQLILCGSGWGTGDCDRSEGFIDVVGEGQRVMQFLGGQPGISSRTRRSSPEGSSCWIP